MTGERRESDLLRETDINVERRKTNVVKKRGGGAIRDQSAGLKGHLIVLLILRARVKVEVAQMIMVLA